MLAVPPSEFANGPLTEAVARSAPPTTAAESIEPTDAAVLPEAVAPKEPTTTPYWVVAAVILLLATVLVGVAGGRSLGYLGGTPYVQIPFVKGLTATAAQAKLTDAKLKIHIDTLKNTNPANTNIVMRNSPQFPTNVKQGAFVTLYVGGKVTLKPVPTVINRLLKTAEAILGQRGFKFTVTTLPYTLNSNLATSLPNRSLVGQRKLRARASFSRSSAHRPRCRCRRGPRTRPLLRPVRHSAPRDSASRRHRSRGSPPRSHLVTSSSQRPAGRQPAATRHAGDARDLARGTDHRPESLR